MVRLKTCICVSLGLVNTLPWNNMVCFFFLLLLVTSVYSRNDYKLEMLDMVKLERKLISNLKVYKNELEEKLQVITEALGEYKKYINVDESNPDLYLSNQLYAFKLKRHLSQDWTTMQVYMEKEVGSKQLEMQRHLVTRMPNGTQYKEEAQKLHSIFQFYDFHPNSFLMGNNSHMILSPLDCYHMGVVLYSKKLYHEAANWLAVAANNYTTSPHSELLGIPKWRVYSAQSQVYVKLNMWVEAQAALQRAISLEPKNSDLWKQKKQLDALDTHEFTASFSSPAAIVTDLQQVCKGITKQDTILECVRISDVSQFLQLAPLQFEEILIEPYTILYRNAIHEREIQSIKHDFEYCPQDEKFDAGSGVTGCFISPMHSEVASKISARVEDMTGLIDQMDGLLVFEYGPTNAFQLFKLSNFADFPFDILQATAVFFLNDIVLGGALALPEHKTTLQLRRGEALVTFTEDYFEHTVCPNVVGTGLVLVKFLA